MEYQLPPIPPPARKRPEIRHPWSHRMDHHTKTRPDRIETAEHCQTGIQYRRPYAHNPPYHKCMKIKISILLLATFLTFGALGQATQAKMDFQVSMDSPDNHLYHVTLTYKNDH